jgi:5-formyltetrahydrofolate cyclo-ligase
MLPVVMGTGRMYSQLQIEAEKQAMRAKARAARQAIPNDERTQAGERVARIGLGFLGQAAGVVAAYHPVRSEFDSMPLLRRLVAEGWTLALPVIVGAAPLQFRQWTFSAPLGVGPFGIPEPVDGPLAAPDVLLVPLLAFDAQCYRLGYGGGHYDRTLAALRRQGTITAIGLAFDAQQVAQVPVCPYDQRLDWILTPSGAIGAKDSL